MAIYYIDPHTTTNGTGTWASPWSLASATRTGLASNDEIRIKGVALTSLLTATSYTATVTNNYQLTITAGGGLGADWAAGNVGYLPDFNTFFKVYSVAGNVVQVYTASSMLPIYNWGTTSVTLRKVDTTTYPVSSTGSVYYISSSTAFNNITVSDCWTDATTRVTDGTVKSLFNTSSASTMSFYPTGSAQGVSGWTLNLQNTHIVCGTGTSTGSVETLIYSSSSTYNINQIFSWGSSGPGITFGAPTNNTTVNITTFNNYYGLGSSNFTGQNNTVNITNLITYVTDIFGNGGGISSPNNTVNITNFCFNTTTGQALFSFTNCCKATINVTGYIDQYGTSPASYITAGYGDVTLNLGSGLTYYYNKRVSTKSSWTYYLSYTTGSINSNKVIFPTVNPPSGWTYTTAKYQITNTFVNSGVNGLTRSGLPQTQTIVFPQNSLGAFQPYGYNANANQLVIFKDGSAPFELLGVSGAGYYTNGTNNTYPVVTTDATVYRTTGPSLKSYLASKNTAYWGAPSKATKTIKIPCTSGTSYTVTGYVRTDDAAYTNGDCRVGVYLNDAEVTGQNMTTSCINAWEQFTLTFTATTTGEYVFTWSMYYANGAKSYWLDDLTIA